MPEDIEKMDNSLLNMISIALIGLLGLGVGVVIGYILAGMRLSAPQSGAPRPKHLSEIARIWRDRRSGRMTVEMDGKNFLVHSQLGERQRAALTDLHTQFREWLGVTDQPKSNSSPPAPETAHVPARPVETSPSRPLESFRAASPNPQAEIVRPPSMDVSDILSRAMVPDLPAKAPMAVFKSIASQIDEIIQERLPDSAFAGRDIRLHDLPDGGMVVMVNEKRYPGIGEVDDPAVRLFLQECIKEWERRTGGG
jgi:hypothetical protein